MLETHGIESLGSNIAVKPDRKGLTTSWQQQSTLITSSWINTSLATDDKLWRNLSNTGLLLLQAKGDVQTFGKLILTPGVGKCTYIVQCGLISHPKCRAVINFWSSGGFNYTKNSQGFKFTQWSQHAGFISKKPGLIPQNTRGKSPALNDSPAKCLRELCISQCLCIWHAHQMCTSMYELALC